MKLAVLSCSCQKQLCRLSPGPWWLRMCLGIIIMDQTAALLLGVFTVPTENGNLPQSCLTLFCF